MRILLLVFAALCPFGNMSAFHSTTKMNATANSLLTVTSNPWSSRTVLGILHVPTLIVVGDHDECDPTLSREMNTLIPGSKLTVLPKSGHLTFVDQNEMFLRAVGDFVR